MPAQRAGLRRVLMARGVGFLLGRSFLCAWPVTACTSPAWCSPLHAGFHPVAPVQVHAPWWQVRAHRSVETPKDLLWVGLVCEWRMRRVSASVAGYSRS